MRAVGHHQLPSLGIQLEQFGGIEQAGIAVGLAGFAQDKRLLRGQDHLYLFFQFLLKEALVLHKVYIQRIIVVGQAVRHHFHFPELRRQTAERLNQARIPVYFHVNGRHNAVVGRSVLVEVVEFLAHLLQGIADIEGVVLLLGIQHQGQVVAFLDDVHHFLVLHIVPGSHMLPRAADMQVIVIELPAQVGKRGVQPHSRKNCRSGHGNDEHRHQDGYKFARFHSLVSVHCANIGIKKQKKESLSKKTL